MRSTCEKCKASYDDFVRSKICPHDIFPVSDSAKLHLFSRGLCVECGRHADADGGECEKDQTHSYRGCPHYIAIRKL